MRVIEKTKQFLNIEKGKIKINFLKLILAVPFWIVVIALIFIGFGVGRAIYLIDTRPDSKVAEMWQSKSETSFRHMVVYAGGNRANGNTSPLTYVSGGKSIHLGDLPLIRQSLQASANTGTGASGMNIPSGNKLRGWEDCYSSTVNTTVSAMQIQNNKLTEAGKANVQLVAVGGNYKAFHPYRYLSGGFLPETPVDTYQIVINDVLAWKFYRSYNVVGNQIDINGKLFTIIGVVEEKSTKVSELAGEQNPRAFIYFSALGSVFGGNSENIPDNSDSDFGGGFDGYGNYYGSSQQPSNPGEIDYAIQCYEALLPEMVRGVAVSDFKNAIPSYSLTNPQVYVVNDTGRLTLPRVIDTIFPLGETEKERMGYDFPYWEVATQMTETRLFYDYVITAFGVLLLLIGIVALALQFRVRKTVLPEELGLSDPDEEEGTTEKSLAVINSPKE